MTEKIPCIYIMASKRNGTLYTGVTSNLKRRIEEHKRNKHDGFTKRHNIHTLVYYETCETMLGAIEREKQIKAGSRKNKLDLIEKNNPEWIDLINEI
jgi:putative endonuclease